MDKILVLRDIAARADRIISKDSNAGANLNNLASTSSKRKILFRRAANKVHATFTPNSGKRPADVNLVGRILLDSIQPFTKNARVWEQLQNNPDAIAAIFEISRLAGQGEGIKGRNLVIHLDTLIKWHENYGEQRAHNHHVAGPDNLHVSLGAHEPNVAPVLNTLASKEFSNITQALSIALKKGMPTNALAKQLGTRFAKAISAAPGMTTNQLNAWVDASKGVRFKAQMYEVLKSRLPDVEGHASAVNRFLDAMHVHTQAALQGPLVVYKGRFKTAVAPGSGERYHLEHVAPKQGGVQSAGPKGGVHRCVDKNRKPVDFDGKPLNILDANGQATDIDGRTFTVQRGNKNEIISVRYDDGGKPKVRVVEENQAGELIDVHLNLKFAKIDKPDLALVKQEERVEKTMLEFFGAEVYGDIYPDLFPKVYIVDTSADTSVRTDKDIYVASRFFRGYEGDWYKDLYRQNDLPIPGAKPLTMGFFTSEFHNLIENAFAKMAYLNFGPILATRMLGGDVDVHPANIGVVRGNELVGIDLAGTGNAICSHPEVQPHSQLEHIIFTGPVNRPAQYPLSRKTTPDDFIAALDNNANHKYDDAIDRALDGMTPYFSADAFRKLADRFGITNLPQYDSNDTKVLATEIATKVKEVYKLRQTDLARFSAQLKVGLCCANRRQKNDNGEWDFGGYQHATGETISFEDVVTQHHAYFGEIFNKQKDFKFRDKTLVGIELEKDVTLEAAVITQARKILDRGIDNALGDIPQDFDANAMRELAKRIVKRIGIEANVPAGNDRKAVADFIATEVKKSYKVSGKDINRIVEEIRLEMGR